MADSNKDSGAGKKRECFVIMPISDPDGYQAGHFKEVYTELIKPSVEDAGLRCNRADEVVSSNLIHLDVVTRVVNADICICDLSSRNPNVLFEYGIRQAFDKPTVLIKDNKTERIFDISGFRDIEYDYTLRIKNILSARADIKAAIDATIDGGGEDGQIFSLVKLMSLAHAAKLPVDGIDQEEAQYQIIGKRLEAMQDMMQRLERRMQAGVSRINFVNEEKPTTLKLMDNGKATVVYNGHVYKFSDFPSFEESSIAKKVPNYIVDDLREHLMPF